jgi:hypothetical protein
MRRSIVIFKIILIIMLIFLKKIIFTKTSLTNKEKIRKDLIEKNKKEAYLNF